MEKDKLLFMMNDSGGNNYYGSEQLTSNFFNPNWDTQSDPFESNLSSIVSSPAVSTPINNGGGGGGDFLIRELIGRLGDISNNNNNNSTVNSTNSSRHITPLNSPKLSNMDSQIRGNLPNHPSLGSFAVADPCFADRAARFSSFGGFNLTELPQLNVIDRDLNSDKKFGGPPWSSSSMVENGGDSMEQSTVSEQVPSDELNLKIQNYANGRKRKVIPRGKNHLSATDCKAAVNDQSNAKRSKTDELKKAKEEANNGGADSSNPKQDKENSKPEPPKDYIHVRARRGQATDSHSLAERVRREKISERMKFLQDLVPGCNKVTGKAVMLDEIINYVQSLQHQVEFLSMKLATVNPTIHYNLEPVLSKDIFQYREALSHAHYLHQNSLQSLHDNNAAANQFSINPIISGGLPKNASLQMLMPHVDGPGDVIHQTEGGLWGDDLQSVIQMGFGQEQPHNIHGSVGTAQ